MTSPQAASPPIRTSRRWCWISGWAVAPAVFHEAVKAAWPHDHHEVFPPTAEAVSQVVAAQPDRIGTYSLGALLWLSDPLALASRLPAMAIAPILAFDQEAGRGGRTRSRAREQVTARFEKDPRTALRLYLRLAGLADLAPAKEDELPYAQTDLAWGLQRLAELHARPEACATTRLFVGEQDPMVDPARLRLECPEIETIKDAGHDFRDLLPSISQRLH